MRDLISETTIEVIQTTERALPSPYRDGRYRPPEITTTSSLRTVRARLIELDRAIAEHSLQRQEIPWEEGDGFNWLFYEREIDIVPVYQEAVALVERLEIVEPNQVQNLLDFTRVAKSRTAIESDIHNKGFHFHYGEVKRDALVRYDVLLTFNKANVDQDGAAISDAPLYIEPHGRGRYQHIDASTIGNNRRLPIYLICDKMMRKKGIRNFMLPSNDSWQFYPDA